MVFGLAKAHGATTYNRTLNSTPASPSGGSLTLNADQVRRACDCCFGLPERCHFVFSSNDKLVGKVRACRSVWHSNPGRPSALRFVTTASGRSLWPTKLDAT